MGRFPEVVPDNHSDNDDGDDVENLKKTSSSDDEDDKPPHDSFSVLFHLSHAAHLHNAPACLALARVHAGLTTHVSALLDSCLVPLDFEAAKDLLRRAMEASGPSSDNSGADEDDATRAILQVPMTPRVAAGCLLFQILQDERSARMYLTIDEDDYEDTAGDNTSAAAKESADMKQAESRNLIQVAEDTLNYYDLMEKQNAEAQKVKDSLTRTGGIAGAGSSLKEGDRVEGNYFMEGTFYPGTVTEVSQNGDGEDMITVCYDDDGSSETLGKGHVRLLIPPTATQTNLGGPLSDDEAFGGGAGDDQDDKIPMLRYELFAELANLKLEIGDKAAASEYYQQAAEGAMEDNKMKTATEWSLKAAELQD